ncbi:unnamed protein product [Chrysoparadoxa australica]
MSHTYKTYALFHGGLRKCLEAPVQLPSSGRSVPGRDVAERVANLRRRLRRSDAGEPPREAEALRREELSDQLEELTGCSRAAVARRRLEAFMAVMLPALQLELLQGTRQPHLLPRFPLGGSDEAEEVLMQLHSGMMATATLTGYGLLQACVLHKGLLVSSSLPAPEPALLCCLVRGIKAFPVAAVQRKRPNDLEASISSLVTNVASVAGRLTGVKTRWEGVLRCNGRMQTLLVPERERENDNDNDKETDTGTDEDKEKDKDQGTGVEPAPGDGVWAPKLSNGRRVIVIGVGKFSVIAVVETLSRPQEAETAAKRPEEVLWLGGQCTAADSAEMLPLVRELEQYLLEEKRLLPALDAVVKKEGKKLRQALPHGARVVLEGGDSTFVMSGRAPNFEAALDDMHLALTGRGSQGKLHKSVKGWDTRWLGSGSKAKKGEKGKHHKAKKGESSQCSDCPVELGLKLAAPGPGRGNTWVLAKRHEGKQFYAQVDAHSPSVVELQRLVGNLYADAVASAADGHEDVPEPEPGGVRERDRSFTV